MKDPDRLVQLLLKNPGNSEAFTQVFSLDKHWEKVDKNIKVPSGTAMAELECPECLMILRVLYNKFEQEERRFSIQCPHCKESVHFVSTFEGYTAILSIDYDC